MGSRRRRLWFGLLALAAGCGGASGHEAAGDRKYGDADFLSALQEYRLAAKEESESRLLIKLGAAALRAGAGREAIEAYLRLAREDKSRLTDAADGLDNVARMAERNGDDGTLMDAVSGLMEVAPERSVGRYALRLARGGDLAADDLVPLLPHALAAVSDAVTADSLLLRFGVALQQTGQCPRALSVLASVQRRSREAPLRNRAARGIADCALSLGEEALKSGRFGVASRHFALVARMEPETDVGRAALIGSGRAQLLAGDTVAAAIAWQRAVGKRAKRDSLGQVAEDLLKALEPADSAASGDSTR